MKLTIGGNLEGLEENILQFRELLWSESEISSAFSEVFNKMNEVMGKCKKIMSTESSGQKALQETRKELASVWLDLHKCNAVLENKLSLSVEAYRTALGDHEEAFEKLIESEQKSAFPQAYEALQKFNKITRIQDESQHISDKLMDLSSEIERQNLQQHETPPIGHFDLGSTVPAPPTLSP